MTRITAPPNILGSKPIIAGTRISVEFILQLLASGVTDTEILLDYPPLHPSREDELTPASRLDTSFGQF